MGPSSPSPKGAHPPIFVPCLLCPNGCLTQDASWYGGRPRPRPHCVTWGPSSTPQKGAQPPICGPCLLWPNGRPSQLLLSTCWDMRADRHTQTFRFAHRNTSHPCWRSKKSLIWTNLDECRAEGSGRCRRPSSSCAAQWKDSSGNCFRRCRQPGLPIVVLLSNYVCK